MSKKGRPVLEGSARQARLAAQAERVAANGGVVKRGRPAKAKVEGESIELVEITAANGGIE